MSILSILGIMALLVGVDQLTKLLVQLNLWDGSPLTVIPHILQFRFIENTGAAFSMFSGKTFLLGLFTGILIAVGLYLLLSKSISGKLNNVALLLIVSGGTGNLIDRVARHSVVDFIEFTFVDFAVFNFADICVTTGAILLMISILFGKNSDSDDGGIGHGK
ncbi:MAG: signal peptidase II [Clostridia bacterium]|nr:signal peptidase II [Clostridia bacterium]